MRQGLGQVNRAALLASPVLAAGVLAVAGCDQAGRRGPRLDVGGAYIVLPAVPERPGTLYFVIDAGDEPPAGAQRRIKGVKVEGAAYAEMHRSMTMDGMARMRPLTSVPIEIGLTRFCPGGLHVMLYGIEPRLKPGTRTRVHLRMNDGKHLDPDATVVSLGESVRAEPPFDCAAS